MMSQITIHMVGSLERIESGFWICFFSNQGRLVTRNKASKPGNFPSKSKHPLSLSLSLPLFNCNNLSR